ncbi:MAG: 4'-phosphopantetheinyl transferase superfamily protein [Dermatophilaceae bacterium]
MPENTSPGIHPPVPSIRSVPSLTDDIVHVWLASSGDLTPYVLADLSEVERRRFDFYLPGRLRSLFAVGASTLRRAASAYLRCDVDEVIVTRRCRECGGDHGRPVIENAKDSPLHVSVSHAGDSVLVAFARHPLGVDVEPIEARATVSSLASYVLSREERRHQNDQEALLRTWVVKEAALKALGRGLAIPMHTFAISDPADPRGPWTIGLSTGLVARDLPLGCDYVAALATARPSTPALILGIERLLSIHPAGRLAVAI